jgi:hypothetical protein
MPSSESFEEFLGEEVVDFDGNPIGTFACYWERIKGRPVLLGIDCDGDQKRTRVAPAKGAWLNVKQTYLCLPYAKEYVEQAPCLDCNLELDAAFEERVYNYYGMELPYPAGTDPQSKLNKTSQQVPTEKTGDSRSSPGEVSPGQSTHPTESHHDS